LPFPGEFGKRKGVKGTEYRLVALDLDGTLLGPDGKICREHRQALERVRARGLEVTLVTARSWRSTAPLVQELGLTAPVICLTGAATYDPTGRPVALEALPLAALQRIVAWSDAEGWALRLYTPEGTVLQSRALTEYQNKEGATFAPPDRHCETLAGHLGEGALFLQAVFLGERSVDGIARRLAFVPEVTATAYERGTAHARIHLFAASVSKGAALARYCRERSIPREAVIAMGDTAADKSMVEWAGTGVAVGESPADLRAVANLIIPADDPSPVATALAQLVRD
jgi:Cof subfamily protein (haloacid dehalogenase superfamily)